MVAPLVYDATLTINWKFAKGEFVMELFFNTWLRRPAFVIDQWFSIDKQKYNAKSFCFISVQKVKLANSLICTSYSYRLCIEEELDLLFA